MATLGKMGAELGQYLSVLAVPQGGVSLCTRLSEGTPSDWWNEPQMALSGQEEVVENMKGPWLVAPLSGTHKRYSPWSNPHLHRDFARLEEEPEAIVRFASQYGLLGHTGGVSVELSFLANEGAPALFESVWKWYRHIQALRSLLELWDLVRQRNVGRLGQLVRWPTPTTVEIEGWNYKDSAYHRIADKSKGYDEHLLQRWHQYDLAAPARYFVCNEINEALKGHVSPAILPFKASEIWMFPDCLLSALYVLFALEVSGRAEHPPKTCKGCGRTFTPARRDQSYCEVRCQKNHWWHVNRSRENVERASIRTRPQSQKRGRKENAK